MWLDVAKSSADEEPINPFSEPGNPGKGSGCLLNSVGLGAMRETKKTDGLISKYAENWDIHP